MRTKLFRELTAALLCGLVLLQSVQAAAPGWWSTQGVRNPQKMEDDYAVANVGQLKAVAAKAAKEMNEQIQQGAGNEINNLITAWRNTVSSTPRDDFSALTLGQLKAVAKRFHDRLAVVSGNAAQYPWSSGSEADDFSLANLGQLKAAFAFVVPSPVWRLGDASNPSPDDLNQDGLSDAYAAANGVSWNPRHSDSNNNGVSDWVEAWNGGPVGGNGSGSGGLMFWARTRSGHAFSLGTRAFVDEATPRWFATTRLNINVSDYYHETNTSSTTTLEFTHDFTRSHLGELSLLNPIITSAQQAAGNDSPQYQLSLTASLDYTRNSSEHTVSGSYSRHSMTDESWSASIDHNGAPGGDINLFSPAFSGDYAYSRQWSGSGGSGSETRQETFWVSGLPEPPFNMTEVPPLTVTATLISTMGEGSGSSSSTSSGWNTNINWSRSYSYSNELAGEITLESIVNAALGDIEAHPWIESRIPYDPDTFGGYASGGVGTSGGGDAGGSQMEYGLDYAVPVNVTKALPAVPLKWFEVYAHTHKDAQGEYITEHEVIPREVVMLPGQQAGPFMLDPLGRYRSGTVEAYIARTGYVHAGSGRPLVRLSPTTAPPGVSLYVTDEENVVIDAENSTATMQVSGFAFDPLAMELPPGTGADLETVDIYVNGSLAAADVPLEPDTLGDTVVPGRYKFGPVEITSALSERITIEAETSENMIGRTQRSGIVLRFDPVLGEAPVAQPRQISARLQLPDALSPTVVDAIGVLPLSNSGTSVTAVETDVDTNVFVTADGIIVSLPDGYTGLPTAQTIQCFIPSAGGSGGGSGVLVPGGGSVTCAETGSDTNQFIYQENTPGFELPPPVEDWTYWGVWDQVPEKESGDFVPFTYSSGIPDSHIDPLGNGLSLAAPSGLPRYANDEPFQAFIIPAAAGGYELLYYNHDAAQLVRVPCPASFTASIQVEETTVPGASIGLWTLGWQDMDGQLSDGPAKVSAAALAAYVTRPGHDGVEIPDEMCARVAVTGLLTGHGVKVESSEHVDSFMLVPPDQMPVGGAIVSRLAPLQATATPNTWRSQHKIIIYESSPGIDRITDQEWNALKDAGYLAVHNQTALASIVALGAEVGALVSEATEVLHEHHLFQNFSTSKVMAQRAANFWKALGINPDDFTVKIPGNAHNIMHSKKISDTLGGWNAQWRELIKANTDDITGQVTNTKLRQLKRDALDMMWKQIGEQWKNKIGTDFPIENVKPFRRPKIPAGASLQSLMDIDHFDGNASRSKEALEKVAKRWGGIVARAEKTHGKQLLKKLMPSYVQVASSIITLIRAGGSVRLLIAEVTGLSVGLINALAEAPIEDISFGEPAPNGPNEYTLQDGNTVYIGMPWRLYKVKRSSAYYFEIIEVWEGKITDIVEAHAGGARMQVTYKTPSMESQSTVIFPRRTGLGMRGLWDSKEVGDTIPLWWNPRGFSSHPSSSSIP